MAEIKTEEELLLQNNDTFREENSDIWKLKGKTRAAEARGFFGNIIASVWAALSGKADLVEGKVPIEQLPELGSAINSTDDLTTEGATNKWFTDARVYLASAANYVIQGTTRAITTSDTLGMILGIFENRLNTLGASITSLTSSLSGYVQKADTARTVASTGTITLTLDRDAFPTMTGGQLTGNLTVNLTGGVKGVVQVLTFEGNGSATVTVSGATMEGTTSFKSALGATNKLWVRCGQDKTGALKYFYQWG